MKDLLRRKFSFVLNQFPNLTLLPGPVPSYVLLFDSSTAAQDIAFMLSGQWDGCNGVVMPFYDEVSVNTAAKLYGASWCKRGDSIALLIRLMPNELISRYAAGERNFSNANLRCAMLAARSLKEVKLSYGKLNWANLSEANLSGADLTAADLSDANLTGASLSKSDLVRTNLSRANLELADLREANLSKADLSDACLREADLRGANLSYADLRGADLSEAKLDGACLTDAKLTLADMKWATLPKHHRG
jgi:uncharacterized protein YjbI with pentapeptide repeats